MRYSAAERLFSANFKADSRYVMAYYAFKVRDFSRRASDFS